MVRQNCTPPFRELFAPPAESGQGNFHMIMLFRNKDLQEDCIKNKEMDAFA